MLLICGLFFPVKKEETEERRDGGREDREGREYGREKEKKMQGEQAIGGKEGQMEEEEGRKGIKRRKRKTSVGWLRGKRKRRRTEEEGK